MSAIATSQPEPLSKSDATTPPALDHLVKICLAKDPEERWQSARDLLAELRMDRCRWRDRHCRGSRIAR